MTLTEEEKSKLFDEGKYSFPTPPVTHAHWNKSDWMKWIDGWGIWNPKKEKIDDSTSCS